MCLVSNHSYLITDFKRVPLRAAALFNIIIYFGEQIVISDQSVFPKDGSPSRDRGARKDFTFTCVLCWEYFVSFSAKYPHAVRLLLSVYDDLPLLNDI